MTVCQAIDLTRCWIFIFQKAIGQSGARLIPLTHLDKNTTYSKSAEELGLGWSKVMTGTNKPSMEALKKTPTAPVMSQALSSFVENIARSLKIQDNLQLNVLNSVEQGTEGVKVGLDKLKLDSLISMLYKIENHRPVIRTSNLSISVSPGERLVRASFQVHKQKIN